MTKIDAAGANAGAPMNANLRVALDHARAGIPNFPAAVFRSNGSGKWQKQPLIKGWQQAATTDEGQIRRWWKEFPSAVPGIELGRAGLVVIDADRHPGAPNGVDALRAVVKGALAEGRTFPLGPATLTAGNGWHLYFRQPDGERVGNRPGRLPDGIDVRGDGGWIVAPGSVRPDGAVWEQADGRPSLVDAYPNGVPPLPIWLADIIRARPENVAPTPHPAPPQSSPSHAPSSPSRERRYAAAALDRSAAELAGVPRGNRNHSANSAAFVMGRMVARGWIDESTVINALFRACEANGLVADDGASAVQRTISSGLTAGMASPHADLAERTRMTKSTPMAGAAQQSQDDDANLAEMNAAYAAVKVGGKTRVVEFEESSAYRGHRVPIFSTIADFCAFHAKRKKLVPSSGGTKQIGLGRWWISHQERRQYTGIIFSPNAPDNGRLNLWTGFACTPQPGNCDLYLTHLEENICAGNAAHAAYLLNWMAYAVQYPDRPGEVAVVTRGKQGVGKGVFARWFGSLFGSQFCHVHHAKHLVGHFNAHLQQCSLLFADESFFAGDKSHESILKALVTEETILIEPKGIDPFAVRNCIHLIMASNARWVVPADADDRRFYVLDVDDKHAKDTPYFAAIAHEMNHGGREALLHHLLNRDLSRFNVRIIPQTAALAKQKQHSRRGIDRLVEIIAEQGKLPAAHQFYQNVALTSGEDDNRGFYAVARSLVPDLKHEHPIVISRVLRDDGGYGLDGLKSFLRAPWARFLAPASEIQRLPGGRGILASAVAPSRRPKPERPG
jgi:hypothetical protein